MSRLGKSQLYLGKVVTPEEIVKRVNKVTISDIRELAEEVLDPDGFSLASIGPWDDCGSLKRTIEDLCDK
jgi:predicted Zn-dependent peptidase